MKNIYDLDILPILLNRFKVNNIVISGASDKNILNQISDYCDDDKRSYLIIDSKNQFGDKSIVDYTLNVLQDLRDFDAIFLNDDPNWFTVYNELNLIKNNNKEFPLVFICHNKFPNKFRDAYSNPSIIPEEYRENYVDEFPIFIGENQIMVKDGLFHSITEKTPKNGVNEAINDFLNENKNIGIMDIQFLNEILILYPKNSISQIRLGLLEDEINDLSLEFEMFSDNIPENKLLLNYINSLDADFSNVESLKVELSKKESIIDDYKNELAIQSTQLDYKDSQIDNIGSRLSLKESEIKYMESKLLNHETKIDNMDKELQGAYNQVNSLKQILQKNEEEFKAFESEMNNKINQPNLNHEIELKTMKQKLNEKESTLDSIKNLYYSQLFKLDNKDYCISCYKEELLNNHLEIKYLKGNAFARKLFNPLAYFYLFLKSNPKELSINVKLYKALKNSKCFDIGFYLNNNSDLQDSLWCKFLSPELHYVCNGFKEGRIFNKKYFNRNSKEDLLEYILKCS